MEKIWYTEVGSSRAQKKMVYNNLVLIQITVGKRAHHTTDVCIPYFFIVFAIAWRVSEHRAKVIELFDLPDRLTIHLNGEISGRAEFHHSTFRNI